jgi:hypothetical protein
MSIKTDTTARFKKEQKNRAVEIYSFESCTLFFSLYGQSLTDYGQSLTDWRQLICNIYIFVRQNSSPVIFFTQILTKNHNSLELLLIYFPFSDLQQCLKVFY